MKTSFLTWIGNFAIFYLLILGILFIPFIAVIFVLSIKTLLEWRYWIMGGLFLVLASIVVVLYKKRKKYKDAIYRGSKDVQDIIKLAIQSGQDVDISVMGGLVKVSTRSTPKGVQAEDIITLPKGDNQALPMPCNETTPKGIEPS